MLAVYPEVEARATGTATAWTRRLACCYDHPSADGHDILHYPPLKRDEVRSVIEGRGAAPRVPVILHFWTRADDFGSRTPAVRALMERFPQDVQYIGARMPAYDEPPEGHPDYRWLPEASREPGAALDAQVLVADWDGLDGIIERFPDPRSPAALPENPPSDGRYRLCGWLYCLFERHWSFRGMNNALTDYYTDPASVHRLYRALTDFYAGLIDRMGEELHADGVLTSDDIGMQTGPFFRETIFDEFFAPYYRELAEHAHARGMHFWLHACGNIEPFIPRLIDLGLDVIHPIQKYAMDEREIARRYGGRICVWSGIDVQRTIPFGTPDEVRAEVRHLMDTWHRSEGRMLFASGNVIRGDCPVPALEALYEEAYGYGSRVVRERGA
jgi:uroporphyrinogen decarboxylase